MRSCWASIFGSPKKTENSKRGGHQNERTSLFPPGKIVEEVAEISKNVEEFNRHQVDGLDERSSNGQSDSRDDKYRTRLDNLLQGINKWQDVLSAELEARQKMREVGLKRSVVSRADASFMKEIQRLQAEGQLGAFEQLSKLADACQSARDGLGPLEYEGFEVQKKLQGEVWELQQVEDALFESFASELGESYEESSVTSVSSSAHNILEIPPIVTDIERHQSHSETKDLLKRKSDVHDLRMLLSHDETQPVPAVRCRDSVRSGSSVNLLSERPLPLGQNSRETLRNSLLLGLENQEGLFLQEPHYDPTLSLDPEVVERVNDEEQQLEPTSGSDSGAFDLDLIEDKGMSTFTPKQHSSTESFPELLTQFGTKRDRINKWLLHKMLISRSEASLIGLQLQKEPDSSPSQWAKLIIAYIQFNYDTSEPANSQQVKNMSTEGKTSELQQSSNYREEDTKITSHPILLSKPSIEDTTVAPLTDLHAAEDTKPRYNRPHPSIYEGLARVESFNPRSFKDDMSSLNVFHSERPIMMAREGMAT